jgi:hypothetical protein
VDVSSLTLSSCSDIPQIAELTVETRISCGCWAVYLTHMSSTHICRDMFLDC